MKTLVYSLLIIFFLQFSQIIFAGTLHGDYDGTASRKFYVGVYRDTGFQLVDSAMISEAGTLSVPLKNDWQGVIIVACGDYEPSWQEAFQNANPETSLQFVFDGQDIEYKTSWRNQSYGKYLQYGKGCEATLASKILQAKLSALQERMFYMEKLMAVTMEGDAFNASLQEEFTRSVKVFNIFCDSIARQSPLGSFMRLYANMYKQQAAPAEISLSERPAWLAQHMFEACDLQNPMTANVPLFQEMIRQYLYLNTPVGMETVEKIEESRQTALERLQEQCNFRLPVPASREEKLREEILTTVKMEELYPSPDYREIVGGWLPLYETGSGKYRGLFAEDMITVLDKIQTPEIYTGFAKDLLNICAQFGWDKESNYIAEYLVRNTSRLENPAGIIQRAIAGIRVQSGNPAPPVVGAQGISPLRVDNQTGQRVLLVFYENGCGHCDQIIAELKRDYELYKYRGIRIVTIAADTDEMVYNFHAGKYPWPDKLCDFKGLEGENFKNYGVTGTPAIYLIDENGNIEGQFANLEKTGILNE